jgi:hypothetical protein
MNSEAIIVCWKSLSWDAVDACGEESVNCRCQEIQHVMNAGVIGRNRQPASPSGPTRLTQLNLQSARQTNKPHSPTALRRLSMDLLPHDILLRKRPTDPGNTGTCQSPSFVP